jgi:hypothetical protein
VTYPEKAKEKEGKKEQQSRKIDRNKGALMVFSKNWVVDGSKKAQLYRTYMFLDEK